MKNTSRNILFFFLIVITVMGVCAAAVVFTQKYQEHQAHVAAEQELQKQRELVAKEYEDILNEFIKSVSAEAVEYRKQRRILREIVKPHNYETPAYAKENYEEFVNQMAPGLQRQSAKVMGVFDLSGAKLEQLLEEKPAEIQASLREKWNAMKTEHLTEYAAYFENEQRVIKAYENLLRFYFVKSKSYRIENDAFQFSNPADDVKHQELLQAIESLHKNDSAEEKTEEDVPAASAP